MMRIILQLYGPLEKYVSESEKEIEIPDSIDLKSFTESLNIPGDLKLFVSVNGVKASGQYRLRDGDHIVIFPPVSGG